MQRLFLDQSARITTRGAELRSNLEGLASLDGAETISKLTPAGPMCFYLQTQSHLSMTDSRVRGYQGARLLGENKRPCSQRIK